MDTSIKQIMEIVMSSMAKITEQALNGEINFFELSQQVKKTTDAVGLEMIKDTLEYMDGIVKKTAHRKKSYHIQRNNDKRVIATVHGTVEFHRTYYKSKKDNQYVYLLDSMLALDKYERIDPYCKSKLIENSLDMSYEKAAKMATPTEISRQSVKNAIREMGIISNHAHPIPEESRKRVVQNLYIEADEDHVATFEGKNKIMKLVYVYEGSSYVSKGRRSLVGTRYFTGNISSENLWQEVCEYVYEAYDYDRIQNIYVAGDGAAWIKTGLEFLPRSKFVLDHFHLNKYVKIATAHSVDLREKLWEALQNKNLKTSLKVIDEAKASAEALTKKKAIGEVKKYIRNNWTGIENLYGAEKYICSTEGHISHILSSRLSSRPMAWSMIGADEMARMRSYRANGGNIPSYYNGIRKQSKEHQDAKTIAIAKGSVQKAVKFRFGSFDPDLMVGMPTLAKPEFKWLKELSRYAK